MQKLIKLSKNLLRKKNIIESQSRSWLNQNNNTNYYDKFIIMSYNILSEEYMFEQLYSKCDKNYLKWDYRKNLLKEEIQDIKPDILILQELEYDKLDDIKSMLNNINGELHYKQKEDKYKEYFRKDGLGISINKNKFEMLGSYFINFNFESIFSKKINKNENIKEVLENLNYNNISMFSLVKIKNSGKIILVINNHLIFKRNKPQIKFWQILIILEIINDLKKQHNIEYIFMGGDFNWIPNSMLYDLITKGDLNLNINSQEFSNQYRMLFHSNFNSPILIQIKDSNLKFNSNNELKYSFKKNLFMSINFLKYLKFDLNKLNKEKIEEIVPIMKEEINYINEKLNHYQFANFKVYENMLKELNFKSLYANMFQNLNEKELLKTDFKLILKNKNLSKNNLNLENFISHFTIDFKSTCDFIFYNGNIDVKNVLLSPKVDTLKKLDVIPNKYFLSDHFSLVGIVKLK